MCLSELDFSEDLSLYAFLWQGQGSHSSGAVQCPMGYAAVWGVLPHACQPLCVQLPPWGVCHTCPLSILETYSNVDGSGLCYCQSDISNAMTSSLVVAVVGDVILAHLFTRQGGSVQVLQAGVQLGEVCAVSCVCVCYGARNCLYSLSQSHMAQNLNLLFVLLIGTT